MSDFYTIWDFVRSTYTGTKQLEAEKEKERVAKIQASDLDELTKVGFVLHHEVLPAIEKQDNNFGSSISIIDDKQADTAIKDASGEDIYRFHSDFASAKNGISAKTSVYDRISKDPLIFSTAISNAHSDGSVISVVKLDDASISRVQSKLLADAHSIDTEITNKDGEKMNQFHSQIAKGDFREIDNVETNFLASSQRELATLHCYIRKNSEEKMEVDCHAFKR